MSELEFVGVWSPPLKNLSRSFARGLHVVLGSTRDGTADLVELAAGLAVPRRGRVLVSGDAPSGSPSLRSRISSVLAREDWGASDDVRSWANELGDRGGFDALASLERWGPPLALSRPVGSLSLGERQACALAVALGRPKPALVLLHDPLGAAQAPVTERVLSRIEELALESIVVVATPSPADARRLGGALHVLERGVLVRTPPHSFPSALTPGLGAWLIVDCERPRELLAALASSPDVEKIGFDAERAPRRLQLWASDLERLSVAVSRAAIDVQAGIRSLRLEVPDLEAVHAASAGLANAAYRAAQNPRREGSNT
jgi:ABC-type thiamine transport system ATPase subunit